MSLILDSSVTLARIFRDERSLAVRTVFRSVATNGAWVPGMWRAEVANTLNIGIRRGRIDRNQRNRVLAILQILPIQLDSGWQQHCWTSTLDLADRHQLTVYDATYLELALRLSLPLATLDRDLRSAAQSEGVPLLGL